MLLFSIYDQYIVLGIVVKILGVDERLLKQVRYSWLKFLMA